MGKNVFSNPLSVDAMGEPCGAIQDQPPPKKSEGDVWKMVIRTWRSAGRLASRGTARRCNRITGETLW